MSFDPIAPVNSVDDQSIDASIFQQKAFTTYRMSYHKKSLEPWAQTKPYIQPLHEASRTNSILPQSSTRSTVDDSISTDQTNKFGGKSASMLMASAERLPAHLRADPAKLAAYEKSTMNRNSYRPSSSDIGSFAAKKFANQDSLSESRKLLVAARASDTARMISEATQTAAAAGFVPITQSTDYLSLLADNDSGGGHVHTTAAAKRREHALEQRYAAEARHALDVHHHMADSTVLATQRLPSRQAYGMSTQLGSTRPVKAPLCLSGTQPLVSPLAMTTPEPGVRAHSIYAATACDCEASVHDKVITKYTHKQPQQVSCGLHSTSARAERFKTRKSSVPSAEESKAAWRSAAGGRAAYSLALATARETHRREAGPGQIPVPLSEAVASEREKQYRRTVHPPDFAGYPLIKTNLSLPGVYQSQYVSEANEALQKDGYPSNHSQRHMKFGHLPRVAKLAQQ